MSVNAAHYLRILRNLQVREAARELRKLNVYLNRRASREQLEKLVGELDPALVEQRLAERDSIAAAAVVTKESTIKAKQFTAFEASLLPPSLKDFHDSLLQVHQNYLNQYSQRIARLPRDEPSQKERCMQEINDLLGVRTDVKLDPRHISHEYQKDSATLRREVIPILQREDYTKRFQGGKIFKSSWANFKDIPTAQERLLMVYGLRRQKDFFVESMDYLEELLYPKKILRGNNTRQKEMVKCLTSSFMQRQEYYYSVIASLTVAEMTALVGIITNHLSKLKLAPTLVHSFCIALSETIVLKPAVFQKSANRRNLLKWVHASLRAFRSYLQSAELERSLEGLLLQTLQRYSLIKLRLSQHGEQMAEEEALGFEQREWLDQLLVKLEAIVEEVGVSELEGRCVADKLANVRAIIEFAAAEELELSLGLFDKLLISVRSGVEWMMAERKRTGENEIFTSELEEFFVMELCHDIIKVVFLSAETTVDLQGVFAFLWTKFYGLAALDEQHIQSMFLLINITTRYKCTGILQTHEEEVYDLLSRSVETVFREGYEALKKKEVIGFLREEAALLVGGSHRQQFLDLIAARFPQDRSS